MSDLLVNLVFDAQQNLYKALLLFILFGVLVKFTPCNKGYRTLHRGIITDAGYYFIIPILTRFVQSFYIVLGAGLMFYGQSEEDITRFVRYGFGPLGALPLWAQAAITFLLSDVILYWTHRWFHGARMWKFHAIHHSTKQVEWYSTYRFHPINVWLSFTLVDTLMVLLGLSMESIIIMSTFNMLYSGMVHANLNWTFGPFKYIFASPVFHRWHHTTQAEGMDKNFAPTFPLLDLAFGTFYMPEGKRPEHYGITGDPVPESFLGQLLYPFKKR